MAPDPGKDKHSTPVEPDEGPPQHPEAPGTADPARRPPIPDGDGSPEAAHAGSSGLTREEKRVTPEEVRRHAIAQGTAEPSIPGGRNPDSAMCEDRAHPGRIDKTNDC